MMAPLAGRRFEKRCEMSVTIRDVKAILTCPGLVNLVAVKVETSEPGLYGVGCATFTQRAKVVVTAVEEYLKPLLLGRDVSEIEDIWQVAYGHSYWRNGPVLNNALSGVDEALWDIKGKMAGMPLYELFGGKVRKGIPAYTHCDGGSKEEVLENLERFREQGYRYLRVQQGAYGGMMNSATMKNGAGPLIDPDTARFFHVPEGAPSGAYYDPKLYMRKTLEMMDYLRRKAGFEIELVHDVHERLAPIDAVAFAKEMEQYRLFFLEDILPPEQISWFRMVREQCATPLAMGELFNNPNEYLPLIEGRLIDFLRMHLSQIGGLTPARKLSAAAELFGLRTAWHGPSDITPVGVSAQLHLDLSSPAFGIQEFAGFTENEQAVFPGCPVFRDGYLYVNEAPGIGVDIDEEAAAAFPYKPYDDAWLFTRLPDGTSVRS